MSETVLTNAQIVLADEVILGTVAFEGSRIIGVSEGHSSLSSAHDLEGDFLSPGLVELHTDNMERHVTPRPNSHWPAAAALINHDREIAASGITTVCNAVSLGQIHAESRRVEMLRDFCSAVEEQKADGHCKADHFLHLRCEVSYGGLIDLLEAVIDTASVRLLSVMDHTPGQRQFVSLEQYAIYYQGKYKLNDEELQHFIDERVEDQVRYSEANRRRTVEMAQARGLRIASHDDALPEHVDEAVADGISIAEFPTTEAAARMSHENGLAVLMGGPNLVRGKSHNGNLSAREVAENGHLDIISSDYVPASLLYAALLAEDVVDRIKLPQAISMVTRTPARHAGFDDRGVIEEGLRADLLRFRRTSHGPIIREVWREGIRVA